MAMLKIDMYFCRAFADVAANPDHFAPKRPDHCRNAPLSQRIRAAWLVLTGRADALVWPEEQSTHRSKP